MRTTATLHDGKPIEIEVTGTGPTLLMPANPVPTEGAQAEQMRQWGADPALGRNLIDGLADIARVVAFDYEGHVMAHPKPRTFTPANVIADVMSVADAAEAQRFAWYGYSWLAMIGLQLALANDRMTGLAMGGYPPIDGPYREMLQVTTAGYELATGARPVGNEDEWASAFLPPDQSLQFLTLYRAVQGFDDRAAQSRISVPRLCLVGSRDAIQYGPTWGDVFVDLARPVVERRAELESMGWEVHVLDGLDHTQAMQAAQVLPILRPWIGRLEE
jgi:pimeloyl-ACP methyl ester carboxylesterase